MGKKYDLVLVGATGFTGGLLAEYLATKYNGKVTWAIAGRSEEKLKRVRAGLSEHPGVIAADIDIILVDLFDDKSIEQMVSSTRVVASTAGPFTRVGSGVVAACAKLGVHYVDSTGESPWVRRMIDAHQDVAAASGARLVSMCGFDSIPADIGAFVLSEHVRTKHNRYLDNVESFVKTNGSFSGGTFHSAMGIMDSAPPKDLTDRFLLNPDRRPASVPTAHDDDQMLPAYKPAAKAWTVPFLMAGVNTRVVRRSHALLAKSGREYGPKFHYNERQVTSGAITAVVTSLVMGLAVLLLAIPCTRRLALRFGPAPGQGPSKDRRLRSFFKYSLVGDVGGPRDGADGGAAAPKRVRAVVAGGDPGYSETAKMVAESALTLALDFDRIPKDVAGFVTPAAGLGMPLVERLRAAGLKITASDEE